MSNFFIFGELDKMIKLDKGKKFSGLVPGSKMHIIKDCGHMLILENAFEMREKIAEFLKKMKKYYFQIKTFKRYTFYFKNRKTGCKKFYCL